MSIMVPMFSRSISLVMEAGGPSVAASMTACLAATSTGGAFRTTGWAFSCGGGSLIGVSLAVNPGGKSGGPRLGCAMEISESVGDTVVSVAVAMYDDESVVGGAALAAGVPEGGSEGGGALDGTAGDA